MAAADPKRLHWAPVSALWQFLYTLRNGAAAEATPAAGSLPLLRSYTPWLAQGLKGWLPPSADAGRALDAAAGKSLDFGAETVPVSAALLPAAKALSTQLVSVVLSSAVLELGATVGECDITTVREEEDICTLFRACRVYWNQCMV